MPCLDPFSLLDRGNFSNYSQILKRSLRIYFSESVRLMLSHRKPSSSNEAP